MSHTVLTPINTEDAHEPPIAAAVVPAGLASFVSRHPELFVAGIVAVGVLLVLVMTIQNLRQRVHFLERMVG